MKNDERVDIDLNAARGIGYMIFWFGTFALLLYRWFFLNQTLISTIDIFAVWVTASLARFFTLAAKGVPATYPVSMTKKEQLFFVFLVPFLSGLIVIISLYLRQIRDFGHLFGAFSKGYLSTLFVLILYKVIFYFWERKHIE